jgi:hypothetical protein
MKRLSRTIPFLLAWIVLPLQAEPSRWPALDKSTASPQCNAALAFAKTMFESDAIYLYAPPVLPANFSSTLALEPAALDISGGNALKADPAVFDKIPRIGESASRSLYWQKQANHGMRLVVLEDDRGWQGDTYSLYSIKEEITPTQFQQRIGSHDASGLTPLLGDSWRPPLVFRDRSTKEAWAIDVRQPFITLADWHVYSNGTSGLEMRCTVRFRPDVNPTTKLLPDAVQKLAQLVDQTLGTGADEGTLQPTARLRLDIAHTWANVALRPWALPTPYNTREEVDAGLTAWASSGKRPRKIQQEIQNQYPLAQQALAEYYKTTFGRTDKDAAASAAFALDIAFRTGFTFPAKDPNRQPKGALASSNPWRNR